MKCTLIAVGSELVCGDVVNTNTAYLARACQDLGIKVTSHLIVGDDEKRLVECFLLAYQTSDIVILSGGLGPTYDDMTREAIAKALNKKLVIDSKSMDLIDAFFTAYNSVKTENNDRQALIIEGSLPLYNKVGLATGSLLEENQKIVILLPGPPHEMKWVFENQVRAKLCFNEVIVSEMIHFFKIGEAELEAKLSHLMTFGAPITVAPYAKGDRVTVKVTAFGRDEAKLKAQIDKTLKEIIVLLKDYPYQIGEDNIPQWVLFALGQKNKTLSLAESCTGGLLSSVITDIDGASNVYKGGLCAYQKEIKTSLLKVSEASLKRHTVYSHQVVKEMAEGARALFNSDYSIATSGVIGGDDEGSKKGMVYYAFSSKTATESKSYQVYKGEYRDRENLKEVMTKKILADFFYWQKENE